MEEMIETSATPAKIWQMWEMAHDLQEGKEGKKHFRYKVLQVKKGESFSILWKALFVRLIFTQRVLPTAKGSQISYRVDLKGPFGWLVKFIAGNKIKRNIAHVLHAVAKDVDSTLKQ
jgi:hypothetical protein